MNSNNLVLVIEHSSPTDKLSAVVQKAGYIVSCADNFETALDIVHTKKPDLIICGDAAENSYFVDICRQLRSFEPELNLPPVCLVGAESSYSKQVRLKLETGAGEYVETPFDRLKFIRSITSLLERRRTEESLRQKDVIFRSLIESITDIITVISPNGIILYESPSVERVLGRKSVDSLGANAFDFIHPDDRQRVVRYTFNANREEAIKGVEYRVRHDDGSWRIFHSVGRFNKSIFQTQTILITSRDVTGRKLLAERHQAALKKARMIWWEWNPVKDEVNASDNFAEICGSPGTGGVAEGFGLIHPDDAARHRKLVEDAASSGGSYHSEFRIVRRDTGKTVWLEETATAILNDKNNVERLVGIAVDISERKKAEKALRESEEKFKALFRGIPIPVYIWEKIEAKDEFVLIDSNDAGDQQTTSFSSRHFGMRASELLNDEPEILNGLNRCLNEQEIVHIEAEYHHQETKALKILDLYFVCISETLVMVVSRDITRKKFAEEERAKLVSQIETQHRRLNDIITSIPGAVWETQIINDMADHANNYISDYIEKMTGYSVEEWLSEPDFWLRAIHPEDRRQVIDKTNDFIKNRGEGFLEYRFVTKSGDVIWTETQMKTVKDASGQVVSLTGITIDVSERKQAEEALLKSEEQLRQSQRLESVGRLAGGIAHDFNNMLTAINGYSELILRELKEESSIRQKVLEIKKAGERSAAMTQQLLAFSRRQILKPQLLDVNHVVSDMSVLLRHLIGEHIRLKTELSQTQCRVEADPGQLSQVIMNLAVNARDAMPSGGNLIIRTENVYLDEEYAANHVPTAPGSYVLLAVSDTGTGIDDETQKHIFEPFYTTKEKSAGTGLGLATVYGIVKQSGGYIWINSEPGKGATFNIYLPRVEGVLEVSSGKLRIESDLSGDETILLVEDEAAVRELTVKILSLYGYCVIEARDGAQAFDIYKKSADKISLLITDIVMPRMNGRELAEKINGIDPRVRVLFSSGYSEDRNMMRGSAEKDCDFINKPFTPEELGRKVRRLLDKQT